MKKIIYTLLFVLIVSCSNKTKLVYWCGDHECKNEKERTVYFERTMIIEIKEINKSQSIEKKVEINRRIIKTKTARKAIDTKKVIKSEKEKKLVKQKQEIDSIPKEKIVKENADKKSTVKKAKKNEPVITSDNFEEIVKMITQKNKNKPFPDINDFPN